MRGKKKIPFGGEPLRTLATSKDAANPKVEWRYGACHACMGSPCPIRAKVVDGRVVRQAQVPYAKGWKERRR